MSAVRTGFAACVRRCLPRQLPWACSDPLPVRERASARPDKQSKARIRLCRLEQDVLLLAERQLDHAFGRRDRPASAPSSRRVTGSSLTRRPPPLIWRRASPLEATRPALTNAVSTPRPAVQLAARNFDRRQALGERAFLESLLRGLGGLVGGVAAVQQRGRLGRQHLLGLVDLRRPAAPRASRSRPSAAS